MPGGSRYAIQSTIERDAVTQATLYWSNEIGWATRDLATTWTHREFLDITKVPYGGKWVLAFWTRQGRK